MTIKTYPPSLGRSAPSRPPASAMSSHVLPWLPALAAASALFAFAVTACASPPRPPRPVVNAGGLDRSAATATRPTAAAVRSSTRGASAAALPASPPASVGVAAGAGTATPPPDEALSRPTASTTAPTIVVAAEPRRPRAPAQPSRPPRLIISELMTDPLLVDDPAGEFIEVVNLSAQPIDLADLSLELPSGQRVRPVRDDKPTLDPCAVLVITPRALNDGEASAAKMRLPNRAGRVVLRWLDHVVDEAIWTGRWPWPKHRAGRALERVDSELAGTAGKAWRHSAHRLRGEERGSPGTSQLACTAVRARRSTDAPAIARGRTPSASEQAGPASSSAASLAAE